MYPVYELIFYLKIFINNLKLFATLIRKPTAASRWECLFLVCLNYILMYLVLKFLDVRMKTSSERNFIGDISTRYLWSFSSIDKIFYKKSDLYNRLKNDCILSKVLQKYFLELNLH